MILTRVRKGGQNYRSDFSQCIPELSHILEENYIILLAIMFNCGDWQAVQLAKDASSLNLRHILCPFIFRG